MTENLGLGEASSVFEKSSAVHRVVFISSWLNNPYKELLSSGLKPHGIEIKEYLSSTLFIFEILESKPDIIHFHTLHEFIVARFLFYSWSKLFVFAIQLLIIKMLGIKIVWTVHEWKDKICNGKHDISINQARIIGLFINGFITHCNHTKLDIKQVFNIKNDKKLFLIPHGNYIDYYKNEIGKSESREYLRLPNDAFVFLIFGGIHRGKGILEAVRAFKEINLKDVHLVIAGEAGDSFLKEEIVREIGTNDNFHFSPQRIVDDEVQIYMNACDCVVMPYTVFTTSGVALLAMSFSKACIAPKAGFFLEIFDNGGAILYDPKCEKGLVQAIYQVLKAGDRLQEMGRYNFEVADNWSWSYVSRETLKAYKFICES